MGFSRFQTETVIRNLPVVASADPATQQWINWSNFFDGVNFTTTPVLPPDFISPLELFERPSGNGVFNPMDKMERAMPGVPKQQWNQLWDWRDDALYMPGATISTDLRIRYNAYLADIVDSGTTPWFSQYVPIMRCLDALAWYICGEVATARGQGNPDMLPIAAAIFSTAEDAARRIGERDGAEERTPFKASELAKMRDKFTPAGG